MPKVTVLIPVWNRERYLAAAIDSVLAQTFEDFELLIIDDGSTDRSLGIARSYADSRIRIVCNETNLGNTATRNRGLALARGQYLALLDSDDVAMPQRLAHQVAFLEAQPSYALIGTTKSLIDANGRAITKRKRWQRAQNAEDIYAQLLFRCCISQPTVMGRTDILQRYRYDESLMTSQDFDLFIRLARDYPLYNLGEPLVAVRRHDERISGQHERVAHYQHRILHDQLVHFGLTPTRQDVERHFLISRPRSWHKPDASYMNWAREWLAMLRQQNRRNGVYDPAALDRVLARYWLTLGRHAGWSPMCQIRMTLGSPPLRTATGALGRQLAGGEWSRVMRMIKGE
ncbi:glycosyltransferase family 2 protein [Kushneria phosphatilytica]|nr:glycosyltransferase family A protein [Kushneria phosphatilytica]OHV07741.1 hypothetical protein BH688_16295 [Kushneria phosphatilytica]